MYMGLSMDSLPEYRFSSFRYFQKHEKFVTRYCNEDVLILMMDGVLRFREDEIPIELFPGEYYIQRRGRFQQGIEESSEPQYYYIHFIGDFSTSENVLPLRGSADIDHMIPLFRELDLLVTANAAKITYSSVFYQILSQLFNAQDSPQRSVVQKVLAYVFCECNTDATLNEIADAIGYCKTHIINAFQKETGKTPHTYIAEQRLNSAKQLILCSDLSLEQISVQCGFRNYINLYKNFIKVEHISPSEWRLKHKEGRKNDCP